MEHKPADGLPHEAIESGGEGYPLGAGGGATLPLALVVRDAASRVALERLTAERAVDDPRSRYVRCRRPGWSQVL